MSNKAGYKKPPEHSRFKSGTSGNPKGRPKGHRNLKIDLAEELKELVVVTEQGEPKQLTKQRLILKQLFNKAISGDLAASKLLLTTIGRYIDQKDTPEEAEELTPDDLAILNRYLQSRS